MTCEDFMFRVDDILGIQKKTRADLSNALHIPLSPKTRWAKSQKPDFVYMENCVKKMLEKQRQKLASVQGIA